MAVKLRLKRMGRTNRSFFRLNAIKAMNLEKLRPELVNRTQFKVMAK